MNLRARQDKAIAFLFRTEIARHPHVFALGILLYVRAVVAESAIERAQESGKAKQHQQRRNVDDGCREFRNEQRNQYQCCAKRQQRPVRQPIQFCTGHFLLQMHGQESKKRQHAAHHQQADDKRSAADAVPVERTQHCQPRHGFQQVSRRTLAGQAKHDEQRGHPYPQHFFRVDQQYAPPPGDEKYRRHGNGQQPRVHGIADRQRPHAAATPYKFQQIIPVRVEFSGVLADDEFAPYPLRIGIEQKPQPEQRQCNHHRNRHFQRILAQTVKPAVFAVMQIPPDEAKPHRRNQREGLVQQADADFDAQQQRHQEARIKGGMSPVQQGEERQEKPEYLRRIDQEWTPVAVGAEEGEISQ